MAANPADRVVYIDQAGDPQCATGAGLITITPECMKNLTDLRGHLELALSCATTLGGVPVPVKQTLQHSMALAMGRMAGAHILHDIAKAGKADA